MEGAFLLYVLTRLDGIHLFIYLTLILFSIFLFFSLMTKSIEGIDTYFNLAKKYAWIPIVCIAFAIFIPTKKDAIFIAAGVGVIEAAKSETAQRLASKSVLVIEQYLDGLVDKPKGK